MLLSVMPLTAGVTEAKTAADFAWTHGAKSVLVIRVDFSDAPGEAVSQANVLSRFAQANTILQDFSYGQFSIPNVTVTPVLRMPQPYSYYNASEANAADIADDARALATAASFDVSSYWTDVYSFREMTNYGWIGLATLGDPKLWLNGNFTVNTLVHELGHNLGAGHASFWDSNSNNPVGSGSLIEYGDPIDTMGDGNSDFGAYFKHKLEWITDAQVKTATGNTVQRIYAIDYGSTLPNNIYALKVAAGSNTYWLEYRADQAATSSGVRLTWAATPALNNNAALLDMTPHSQASLANDARDAALNLGQSWVDPVTGYTFKVTGKSSGGDIPWIEVSYAQGPEATVSGNGVEIVDGDTSPNSTDGSDFGTATQGGTGIERTFTIANSGLTPLTIGSISVPLGFTLTQAPASTVAAGSLTTFKVKLDTAFAGIRSGQISFSTNDTSENPYNFTINGVVSALSTPIGYIDSLNSTQLSGWAYDPDAPGTAVQMRVRIDGVLQTAFSTTVLRTDVNTAFSLTGTHGFTFAVPGGLSAGVHAFTVFALDTSSGQETFIGSSSLTVAETGTRPIGYVDRIVGNRLVGWAFDPDTASSAISLRVQVDNGLTFTTATTLTRPDVNAAYSITGTHGFSFEIPSTFLTGYHLFTVSAVDTTNLTFQTIGSKAINDANLPPKGYIDSATSSIIQGWAYDPDAPGTSISMVVKLDGVSVGTTTANQPRSDVNTAFSLTGSHGFAYVLPSAMSSGTHVVEIFGIDTTTGLQQLAASRTVVVSKPPVGYLDFVSGTALQGWAYDPDATSQPVNVRVDIDGVIYTTFATAGMRADVNAAFSLTGNHGYYLLLPALAKGTHTINVYALDLGSNAPTLIGGKQIVIA